MANKLKLNLSELNGALGDLGTLIPLSLGLVFICGVNAFVLFVLVGIFYIVAGLFYGIPISVQPLKAVSIIAISLELSASHVAAAGILMGFIMLFLSFSGLVGLLSSVFTKPVVRGIQIGVGLLLLLKGVQLCTEGRVFFKIDKAFPCYTGIVLALVTFLLVYIMGWKKSFPAAITAILGGFLFGFFSVGIDVDYFLPPAEVSFFSDWSLLGSAFILLVIPQIPVTLGNAVYGSCDLCRHYYDRRADKVKPETLSATIGFFDLVAGFLGGMPVCHGSGGIAAHYRFGARTGSSVIMLGIIFVSLPLLMGSSFLSVIMLLPVPVLGAILFFDGLQLIKLIMDLQGVRDIGVATLIASVTAITGNATLAIAIGMGFYFFVNKISFLKVPS